MVTIENEVGSPQMNLPLNNFSQTVSVEEDKSAIQDEELSIRKYQAISSNLLSGDKPNILEAYMELVVSFGYIVLFAEVFPLGALMSLISNLI